jgi:hypothetical protein
MHKATYFILFLLIASVLAGCSTKTPTQNTVVQPTAVPSTTAKAPDSTQTSMLTYNNHGIKIQYPEGWKVREDVPGTLAVFQSGSGILSIGVKDMGSEAVTLENYTAFNVDYKNKTIQDFKIIELSKTQLSGRDAYQLVFTGKVKSDDKELVYKRVQIITAKDNKMYMLEYIISVTANGIEMPSDINMLKRMTRTFEITDGGMNIVPAI